MNINVLSYNMGVGRIYLPDLFLFVVSWDPSNQFWVVFSFNQMYVLYTNDGKPIRESNLYMLVFKYNRLYLYLQVVRGQATPAVFLLTEAHVSEFWTCPSMIWSTFVSFGITKGSHLKNLNVSC